MAESAKRHEENSNIIKEIRASTDAAIRNQGASIKTLEIQIGQMSKVLQERGIRGLPGSTEPNPRDHVKSISIAKANSSAICHIGSGPYAVSDAQYNSLFSETVLFPSRLHGYYCDDWKEAPLVDLEASVSVMPFSTYSNLGLGNLAHTRLTIELANRTIKHPMGIAKNMLVRIGKFIFPINFAILDIPEDDDVPLILGRPFLSTAHAKIDVFKRKITLRVGEEKLVFKSIKPATSIIRRVYMVKERTDLDSKTEFVGEAINESFDPLYGNYIELNDLDMPLEPRMNQDDFEPTLDFINEPAYKSCFSITDDVDITSGVVLGMPFCKKFVSCQKIMERFAHGDECERVDE
ncbi:putative reverse transcriptase domain-containing protein [Tanacetum coccineum]|uniref:Reverse transcriptase domain-containing protein n=1 Tax=Tanacetum coccineum TaxID=301880 RepID=A0ABQ5HGJ6_9ASTR